MTGFMLKILAVITMTLDHIKYAVPVTDCFLTQYFGRVAFPLFAFLITEGLYYTKSRKKYIIRMLIFAIISQVPFILFRSLVSDMFMLNIMFTFLFAILGIVLLEWVIKQEIISIFKYIMIVCCLFAVLVCGNFIAVDYRWFGIVTIWIFYLLKENKILRTIIYFLIVMLYYFVRSGCSLEHINFFSVFFTTLPAIIILFYNGKQGKKFKYFFYWFYPIHMLVIYGLSFIF